MTDYTLLDCGNRQKLETIGSYKIIRPCPQAIWEPFDPTLWTQADFVFERKKGEKGIWKSLSKKQIPENLIIKNQNTKFSLQLNEFGNIGVFTEHWQYWQELEELFEPNSQVLDLFCYSGSSVQKLLKKGYRITAVDSSKNAITLYKNNLDLNTISSKGQRLILEDALKFCLREIRRGNKYHNIIADAPSYGRGTKKNEVFDIDQHFVELLSVISGLLAPNGKFVLTHHSPRYTLETIKILLSQIFPTYNIKAQELFNPTQSGINLPSGFLFVIS